MGSIRRRLDRLEKKPVSPLEEFPDWPLDDQIENIMEILSLHQNLYTHLRHPCTDREVTLLAIVHALQETGGEGELSLPASGITIRLTDDDGQTVVVEVDGPGVVVEDFPPEMEQFVERMEPQKQEARDDWLYGDRHRAALDRERCRYHAEHGWEVPTPDRLRWWEGRQERGGSPGEGS